MGLETASQYSLIVDLLLQVTNQVLLGRLKNAAMSDGMLIHAEAQKQFRFRNGSGVWPWMHTSTYRHCGIVSEMVDRRGCGIANGNSMETVGGICCVRLYGAYLVRHAVEKSSNIAETLAKLETTCTRFANGCTTGCEPT